MRATIRATLRATWPVGLLASWPVGNFVELCPPYPCRPIKKHIRKHKNIRIKHQRCERGRYITKKSEHKIKNQLKTIKNKWAEKIGGHDFGAARLRSVTGEHSPPTRPPCPAEDEVETGVKFNRLARPAGLAGCTSPFRKFCRIASHRKLTTRKMLALKSIMVVQD